MVDRNYKFKSLYVSIIALGFLFALYIGVEVSYWARRRPVMSIETCAAKLRVIGKAIKTYHQKYGTEPTNLSDVISLIPPPMGQNDSSSYLQCSTRPPENPAPYLYAKHNSDILVECHRHEGVILRLQTDGKVIAVNVNGIVKKTWSSD